MTLRELFADKYFCTDASGTPQAIDKDSDGYSYPANYPGEVKFWTKKEDMESCLRVINWEYVKDPSNPRKLFPCQVTNIEGIKL